MKINEGVTDRIVRVAVGVVILSQVFIGAETPWAWLGLVPLVTGVIGYCPIYGMIGLNTKQHVVR